MATETKRLRNIKTRWLGHAALAPYGGTVSAARGAMFLSHIGQAPLIKGNEPRRIMTGVEMRFGEYEYNVHLPVNCEILKIFRKYPPGYGMDAIKHNPVTTVVYQDFATKEVGMVHVPEYMSYHQHFGFPIVRDRKVWERLQEGELFEGGTVLGQSNARKENGLLGMGVNLNVAFYSTPGTIEDGFIISEDVLDKLIMHSYTTAVGSCGRKAYLLNMYGDENTYKPFPDIGERIRPDGVIFATRDLDDDLAPADMTPRALMDLDRTFDKAVIGDPGAIVKDINVYCDDRQNPTNIPLGMEGQLRKYYEAQCNYYRNIIKYYHQLKARWKDSLQITDQFNQLICEATIFLPQPDNQRKLTRMYRLDQLDEYRVEITYEAEKRPGGAFKLTDAAGGKGVICKVEKPENMPYDDWGNRVDVGIFGGSTMRRSNYERIYEPGFNAASRDLIQRFKVELGFDRHQTLTENDLKQCQRFNTPEWIDYAFKELLDFYSQITVDMHDIITKHPDPKSWVTEVMKLGYSYIYSPIEDEVHLPSAINRLINGRFCPNYSQVNYVDAAGNKRRTKDKILIAPMYMFMLEKTGDDWSAVASVKTQQYGLPSKLNNSDRNSTPGRETAIRSYGESETRSYNCTVGPEATVELLDQTNNPLAHLAVVEAFLTSERPSDIDRAVDREVIPYGGSRSVELARHLLEMCGIGLEYSECK